MNINGLRKAELHCHLDGLLDEELFRQLPGNSPIRQSLLKPQSLVPVKDLQDWLTRYNPAVEPFFSNNGENLLEIMGLYLRSLKKQNVVYSEIMISSFLFQHESLDDQLALYKRYRELANTIGGNSMQVEFLIAVGRRKDRSAFEKRIGRVIQLARSGVIRGIAVAGIDEQISVKPFKDLFDELEKVGVGIEIHAGEFLGPESIWDALEYGHAKRIGHGISAFQDPLLVKYLCENDIHLEFCPTSNVLLTSVGEIRRHPIRRALDEGISFSINTDDPGPFGTSINKEFDLVARTFDLRKEDFDKILEMSLSAAFGNVQV